LLQKFLEDNVVDLGCGDGRVCQAACALGASSATGFDLDEELIQKANYLANEMSIAEERRPKFVVKDLFTVKLNEYSVICMFLLPNTMDKLVPKLLAQVSSRSLRIISFGWPIPGLGEPAACCRGMADSTATERWFLYTQDQIEAEEESSR
jgi:ribosomal protein L11 methylase PrmA